MQLTILFIALPSVAYALPQIQQTEKDLVDVENYLEEKLPGILQGTVHNAVSPTVEQAQGLFDAVVENFTTEYQNSSIPAIIETVKDKVTDAIQNPDSPFNFILHY